MSQKITIYDTEEAHNEIGQAIHDAKRRFLDANKKGVPLQSAAETFYAECQNVIDRANIRLQSHNSGETERRLSALGLDSSAAEMTALRDRVAELEADLPTRTSPAPLPDSPLAREVGGYRLLCDVERDYVVQSIGEDAGGAFHVGTVILLLEHLVAFHLQGEYPLEGEVITISDKLLAANHSAIDSARHALRTDTYNSILHFLREQKGGDA